MSAFVPAVAQNAYINAPAGTGALEYLFGECVAADFDAGAGNPCLDDIQCPSTFSSLSEYSVWPNFVEDWPASPFSVESRVRCSPESFCVSPDKSKCGFKRPKSEPKSCFTEAFTTTTPTCKPCFMFGGSCPSPPSSSCSFSSSPVPSESPDSQQPRAKKYALAGLSLQELNERKKQQNKIAARRYRSRKVEKFRSNKEEIDRLEARNIELRMEEAALAQQISALKELMINQISKAEN